MSYDDWYMEEYYESIDRENAEADAWREQNKMDLMRMNTTVSKRSVFRKGSLLKIIIILVVFVIACYIGVNSFESLTAQKHQSEANAIATARMIELNTLYKDKTNRNRFTIFNPAYNYKGYAFSLHEKGTVDIEYTCKRIRKDNGPYMVKWQIVRKETGEIVQEFTWANLDTEPFELEKGDYVIEFASISDGFGMDLVKRRFEFTVHYTPTA